MILFILPGWHSIWIKPDSESESQPITIALPGMVMAGQGQNYYLWAVKSVSFEPDQPLFHAPLPNIYPDGRICWGTNLPPVVSPGALTESWNLFILSPFTTHLAQAKSRKYSSDITGQLLRLSGLKRKRYPAEDLLPFQPGWQSRPWTAGEIVKQLFGNAKT